MVWTVFKKHQTSGLDCCVPAQIMYEDSFRLYLYVDINPLSTMGHNQAHDPRIVN